MSCDWDIVCVDCRDAKKEDAFHRIATRACSSSITKARIVM